ncbi:MAG: CHC2 zinc finger domain-containing protein [Syntrophales bacterium]
MKTDLNNFYTELKSKNDIITCAYELHYKGTRSGSYVQGDCPKHGSQGGKCLVIWSKIQGFKCFHCGESGDVINLVMLLKGCDHKTAVKYLADRVGMSLYGGRQLTPAEIAQYDSDIKEEKLVTDMLTVAAGWFHGQLKHYPDIMDHLKETNYGFSDGVIDQLQIGFAPVSKKSDDTSELADHLNSFPEFRGKIHMTGLFSFKNPSGRLFDFFKGRIVIPYWKGGKVVYMLARATKLTPEDQYEGGLDEYGNYKYSKFKKLRVHDPDDEKMKFVSKFIRNDVFMGEDTIMGADEIIIPEGAPDFISALDHGFNAISPVTTTFREADFEKLERLTRNAKSIFIINDNDTNEAGLKGALKTGKYLTEQGRNVFLVELPKPDKKDKIDLNEYLKNHTADDLRELMKKAKSVLEILIDKLPADFLKALPHLKEEIIPLLVEMESGILQHYVNIIAKKTKTAVKVISVEIEAAKKLRKEAELKKEEVMVDPEVQKAALALTLDPMVFRKRIDVINEAGVVGERRIIAMYLCAMDSRLLPDNFLNPNVLAVKNAGHFGAGKSYTLTMCTQIYPESTYYLITNGSAKSMYYLEGGLKNKCLIVTEGFQFQENNSGDSELVYSIRSLISEGRISYNTVEKDTEGKMITVEKKLEGPTSFITTTIMDNLEPQLEDRLFTIHPDEGIEQTKNIITMTADQRAGTFAGLDKKTVDTWKHYHDLLKPAEVVIPFANKIADYINKNDVVPLSTRRAFKRVLIVIQSVTCAYQYQRKRNDNGRLIAEMADYWMALQIVRESFKENMGAQDQKTETRLEYIKTEGIKSPKEITAKYGISASAVSQWSSKKIKDGVLSWCNDAGNAFVDDRDLKKAKHSGKAYLKIPDDHDLQEIAGLPSTFDLTHDPDWDEGGKHLSMYNLNLMKKDGDDKVFTGVKEVFMAPLNTSDVSEDVDYIEECDDADDAVKVLSENQEDTENNCEAEIKWERLDGEAFGELLDKTMSRYKKDDNRKAIIASDNILQF